MTARLADQAPANPPQPLLVLEQLTASSGVRPLLHGVDLVVRAGETVALLGGSGSGKSLSARAILALPPTGICYGGAVRLDGRDLLAADERTLCNLRGRGVAMVFQEPATALNPSLTIGTQIAEPFRIHGVGTAFSRAAKVGELLDRTGLAAAGVGPERYPHELSGGQRQRVAVAIALALSPALVVADEPTSALDTVAAATVLNVIAQLVHDSRSALVLITHDLAVARRASRVAVMEHGRIVEDGPSELVLTAPRSAAARTLTAAAVPPALPPRPAAGGAPVLQAEGIVVLRRGRPVVQAAGFAIRAGERLAIVGASGSGKTTLVRAVLGLLPSEGTVSLAGVRAARADDPALRRAVGMVFQDPATSFDPRFTVKRIVTEPLHGHALSQAERTRRAVDALALVDLPAEAMARRPHAFSGGQRQRIAIARALVAKPRVLIADEALSALDAALKMEIVALLDRLAREEWLALVFIAHDLALVRQIADRIAVMDAGRIVEEGPPAQIFGAPRHSATKALVAGLAGSGPAEPGQAKSGG